MLIGWTHKIFEGLSSKVSIKENLPMSDENMFIWGTCPSNCSHGYFDESNKSPIHTSKGSVKINPLDHVDR